MVIVEGEGAVWGWIQCKNGVLIDYQLVCENWQYFRTHGIPLNFSYDIVRFKIEVGVEEKFMCKNVAKQMQHAHCGISVNAPLRGGHMYDLDLTINMLRLCDHSNLLFVLSAEERCALLKLLWGLVYSLFCIKCNGYRVINIKGEHVFTCIIGISNFLR